MGEHLYQLEQLKHKLGKRKKSMLGILNLGNFKLTFAPEEEYNYYSPLFTFNSI